MAHHKRTLLNISRRNTTRTQREYRRRVHEERAAETFDIRAWRLPAKWRAHDREMQEMTRGCQPLS
jgi:hypothetical protein